MNIIEKFKDLQRRIESGELDTYKGCVDCEILKQLRESLYFVALVGSSEMDPRVTANARALMQRIISRPEMAIMDGALWEEAGSSPVQAGGTPQEFRHPVWVKCPACKTFIPNGWEIGRQDAMEVIQP